MSKRDVKQIKVSDIIIGERFRDEMGDIEELASSIKAKGLIQPITVDENMKLLAGERRLRAHILKDIEYIDVLVRKSSDELDAREIELMENVHRKEMTWQESSKLTTKIHELMVEKHGQKSSQGSSGWSTRMTAALIGTSQSSVSRALDMAKTLQEFPDLEKEKNAKAARQKVERVTKDIAQKEALEEHKESKVIRWASSHYNLGDALEGLEKLHPVNHFAEVDPPYGVDIDANQSEVRTGTYTEVPRDKYEAFVHRAARGVFNALVDHAYCVWWYGPSWQTEVKMALENAGFIVDPYPGIWNKIETPAHSNAPNYYLARAYEPFYICRKGSAELYGKGRKNIFDYKGVPEAQRIHATERPVELIEDILKTFSWPKARVLCPFLGSGNTLMACYNTGRIGHGWDLSEEHRNRFLTRVTEKYPDDYNPEEQEM